jgi:hypothetical protein
MLLQGEELLLELRDEEGVGLSLAVIDAQGAVESFAGDWDWWYRLVAFDKQHFIFERIEDSMDPGKCSLHIYPRNGGRQFNAIPEAKFISLNQGKLLYQDLGDELELKHMELGTVEIRAKNSEKGVLTPQAFHAEQADFQALQAFLLEQVQMQPKLQIEYLEWNQLMILSFYVAESKGFSNFMGVWDVQGHNKLWVKMEAELEKAAPSSFFVWEDTLIFVSEKVNVNAYKLRK